METVSYEISSGKLPEGFAGTKIAFLTDLHGNPFGEQSRSLLNRIGKIRPDYVCLGGDLMVWRKEPEARTAISLIKELASRYPVYCVNGNHEKRWMECGGKTGGTGAEYKKQIEDKGAFYLENQTLLLKKGRERICLAGLDLDLRYYHKFWKPVLMEPDYLNKLLGKKREEFTILLAHHPDYFPQYAAWGADLVLSGHIHGGLVIFPRWGGLIAPSYRLFPKYDFGLFREGNSRMVLSRGLGTHTIKIRINNKPELSVITLRRNGGKQHGL